MEALQQCDERVIAISIHALREESDLRAEAEVLNHNGISIHALREESDSKIQHNIYS